MYHGNELYFDITFETAWQRPVDVLECRCFAKREKSNNLVKNEESNFQNFYPMLKSQLASYYNKLSHTVGIEQLLFLLNSPSSKSNLDL